MDVASEGSTRARKRTVGRSKTSIDPFLANDVGLSLRELPFVRETAQAINDLSISWALVSRL